MGWFDQAARFAADADPEAAARLVQKGSGIGLPFAEWFDTRTVPMPGGGDRSADRVAILSGQPATLLVFEFQARHDPAKLAVTLEVVGALHSRARHGPDRDGEYRVLAALAYLQGICPRREIDMTTPAGFGTIHRPLVWNAEEESAADALGRVEGGEATWGVLFWIPLFGGANDPALVERWKQVVAALVPDRRVRSEMAGIALVFAELAGCFRVWESGLEGWQMSDSQVVDRWLRNADAKARLEEGRRLLTRALARRFGPDVPPEVLRVIGEQPSLSMLDGWFDEALTAGSMEEFVAVLRR